jgi:hypothetical protein
MPRAVPTAQVLATVVYSPAGAMEHVRANSITGSLALQVFRSVLTLQLDGKGASGKAMRDDLTLERVSTTGIREQATVMSGSLTARIVTDVTKVDRAYAIARTGVYKMITGTYWMAEYADGSLPNCAHLRYESDDPLRNSTWLDMLLQRMRGFFYGRLASEEQVNGVWVKHYVLDADAVNAAVRKTDDYATRTTLGVLGFSKGDAYFATDGGYLVRLDVDFNGAIKDYGFSGTAHLSYNFTWPGAETRVIPPPICTRPSADVMTARDIGNPAVIHVSPLSTAVRSYTSTYTMTLNGRDGAGKPLRMGITIHMVENKDLSLRSVVLEGALVSRMMALAYPNLPKASSIDRIGLYTIGNAQYMLAGSLCVAVSPKEASGMQRLTPESFLLTEQRSFLYGKALPDETVNGVAALHYSVDADSINRLPAPSKAASTYNQTVHSGDVYIAADGSYVVHLALTSSVVMEQYDFKGDAATQYDLVPSGAGLKVQLPNECWNVSGS